MNRGRHHNGQTPRLKPAEWAFLGGLVLPIVAVAVLLFVAIIDGRVPA